MKSYTPAPKVSYYFVLPGHHGGEVEAWCKSKNMDVHLENSRVVVIKFPTDMPFHHSDAIKQEFHDEWEVLGVALTPEGASHILDVENDNL